MHELRWNPVLKWWVMVSSGRQNRPLATTAHCPFCPGSDKVPAAYDVMTYANDWPILSSVPPDIEPLSSTLYKNEVSSGKCEVILYSSDHHKTLGDLSPVNMSKLVDLWISRYGEIGKQKGVKYIFIFENKGKEVGATIAHPHGQIYGFPFIPKKIELELQACRDFNQREGKNLYREILREELRLGSRIVDKNEAFVTFVPYFAEYPYQIYILPREHRLSIDEFTVEEQRLLGSALTRIVTVYNNVFTRDFPYMMSFDQKPVDGRDYSFYQFHIEFFPPLRSEITQKFNAGSETAGWVHGNPSSPEEKALELRTIKEKLYGAT